MMRKTGNMVMLVALMTLCLAAMAFAQADEPAEKVKMMPRMSPDSSKAMMMKMSENYQAMDKSLEKLDQHLKTMMDLEDMDSLHTEMQKHMEMMKSMNMMVGEQNKMCRMMMGPDMMKKMLKMEQMKIKTMEMKQPEKTEKEKKD